MLIDRFKVGETFGVGGVTIKIIAVRGQSVELGFLSDAEATAERARQESRIQLGYCTPQEKP
jgi:hypothetical protein